MDGQIDCLRMLYRGQGIKSIDERRLHGPFHFVCIWGMKWGRRLCRGAILFINLLEETLNG